MTRQILLVLLCFSFLISSCGGGAKQKEQTVAIGGKMYGGNFQFMSSEKIESLFPLSVTDIFSNRIISQIFEPLLKIDMNTMEVTKCLAQEFTVSEDAETFTLKIRKGVFFHDDDCFGGKGREMNAEDVKFTLDMACSGLDINTLSYLLVDRIEGAKEYNKISKKTLPKGGVSGIKVIDPYTIEIKLSQPFVGFDKILTHFNLGIFPREAYEKYGKEVGRHPVGTGAFILETFDNNQIVLERNPAYWQKDEFGNQLPFLDKVTMTYTKNKKSELMAFRNREIDMVLEIPVEEIEHVFGSLEDAINGKNVKHKVESVSSLQMSYIGFACDSKEFGDERVRRAFNLAVDRQGLVDNWLEGEGYPAMHGFVPLFETYPNDAVLGFPYDPAKAKALMAEAGYANGASFPSVEIYVNAKEGSTTHKMITGIAADIKENLGVALKIKLCTLQERSDAIASGAAKMWRNGWIADYPDPENFLCLFYGANVVEKGMSTSINNFNFVNAEFDSYFDKALKELNNDQRNKYLVACDQMIIDHAPVMPILTHDFIVMINVRVKNFKTNAIQALDFSTIFIKEQR